MEITDPLLVAIIKQGVGLEKAIKIKDALPPVYTPPSNLDLAKQSFKELTAEARPLALATLISMLNDPETKERTKLDAARVILVDISKASLHEAQTETIEETEVEKRLKRAGQLLKANNIIHPPELTLIEDKIQNSAPANSELALELELNKEIAQVQQLIAAKK